VKEDFLSIAAVAAKNNVEAWEKRFSKSGSDRNVERPVFLPDTNTCGVIAEVKMASPSRGDLMGTADPYSLPGVYEQYGAEAISVVVEETYFGGSPELFAEVRARTSLPMLWKDFIVDPFQVDLAATLGASAVLLIAGMLEDQELGYFVDIIRKSGMRPLVEVRGSAEQQRALDVGADLIGVNNRDLVSLEVDIGMSEKLVSGFPPDVQAVSESGIRDPESVKLMKDIGYRAVLVGEALVIQDDPGVLLKSMVEAGRR
jgi:indole-3-glycerol phosphate synthase